MPPEWLSEALNASEDDMLEIAGHLPAEAAEALLNPATGIRPPVPEPIAPSTKSLGFDEETLTRLTRLVSAWEWKGATDTMQVRVAGFDLTHPRIAKYLELSIRMLDLPRHLGQHSGGMIIAQGQFASVVPIEPASMPGRNVIQWDKEDVSGMGLIKIDLLGLGMIAVLKDCTNLIPQHYGKTVDIAQIPHDDRQIYASLLKADTIGLFQVESRAQMASLPRNNPDRFYDLVVQVAIIRPGPIVGR